MFRHSDFQLIPFTTFKRGSSPLDTEIAVLPLTEVGDFTSLFLHVRPTITSSALGADARSAMLVLAQFWQLSGDTDPSSNLAQPVQVGGRTMSVGASDQRTFVARSTLDVRLPVIAPFFDIYIGYPVGQTNLSGFDIALSGFNEPTYNAAVPYPSGNVFNTSSYTGDSILGNNNAGLNDSARGILVPVGSRVVEFTNQMLGSGFFSYHIQDPAGGVVDPLKCGTAIVTKMLDDTTGINTDQVIYNFAQGIDGSASGIPLVAFRQSVLMVNLSAVPLVWHWTAYPEFM